MVRLDSLVVTKSAWKTIREKAFSPSLCVYIIIILCIYNTKLPNDSGALTMPAHNT